MVNINIFKFLFLKIILSNFNYNLGGQIIYYPTHTFFLSAHSAYIIVFDYSNPRFQRLEYWFKQLKAQCSGVVAILVGTHADLCTEDQVASITQTLKQKFPRQRYPFFSGDVFPVSCATGSGVPELRSELLNLADNSLLSPACPVSWTHLYNLVHSYYQLGIDRVTWGDYREWAEIAGITNSDDLLKATALLESSGVLVHLHDKTEHLTQSEVILSAQWLADIMACFITTRANFVNNGFLKKDDIGKILKDTSKFPVELHGSILSLLEKFKILYCLGDSYIIPSMLPISRPGQEIQYYFPSDVDPKMSTIGRVYSFPSMPLGFFERFEVAILSHPSLNLVLAWKRGIVMEAELDDDASKKKIKSQILVEYNDIKYELYIYFRYSSTYQKSTMPIFSGILSTVGNMIQGFYPGLAEGTKESIVCTHCIRKGVATELSWRFPKSKIVSILDGKDSGSSKILQCNNLDGLSRAVWVTNAAPDLCLSNINTISRHEVEMGEIIGVGGAGSVYIGTISGTKVAIKQLHIKLSHDVTEKYSEFLAEVSLMR